jgi:hypothetical protein
MNTITLALVVTLLGQSLVLAEEPATPPADRAVLSAAIAVEARRLASETSLMSGSRQTGQPSRPVDTRPGCLRHGAACGAALGYLVGFLAGLMKTQNDFEPMALGLIITGPIGAGIGAAVGWTLAEGTKPAQTPQQP